MIITGLEQVPTPPTWALSKPLYNTLLTWAGLEPVPMVEWNMALWYCQSKEFKNSLVRVKLWALGN